MKALAARLWPLCETVAERLKRADLGGQSVTLKLKTDSFRLRTRSYRLAQPTRLAEVLYQAGLSLLEREADGQAFRLIGIGIAGLVEGSLADPPDLLDPTRPKRAKIEQAIDQVRAKLGKAAIRKGRTFALGAGSCSDD